VTAAQVIDRELDRLEDLWSDGLADAYHSYQESVTGYAAPARPKLALAAALIEVGIRLQNLGGRAAPASTLLVGDLCLARSSRLLADVAPQRLQVAIAAAIETMSSTAAAAPGAPASRELLIKALEASR